MLELRPTCENCNVALPPQSLEARICSFECTFCSACVESFQNVCPNCGGGFCQRPHRPHMNWANDNYLGRYPASQVVKHRPVDDAAFGQLRKAAADIAPHER